MRKSKRWLSLGLAGLMMSSVLAGCSSSGNNTQTTTAAGQTTAAAGTETTAAQTEAKKESNGNKTKITVWTNNRHDLEYMNKVVDEFNNTNDHIEIEYVVQTENYENLITMATTSGQAPDVFGMVSTKTTEFANNGIIQPLNQYLTDTYKTVNEVDSHMYEGLNSIGDDIYWVPCGKRSGARIIYNKEIFDNLGLEVPAKLSDMVDIAKQITEAGNGDYYGIIFPGASGPFERWLEHSAEKSGITRYDYANGKFDFSGYKPYLEFVRELYAANAVFPGSSSIKIDPARVQFSEGHVGIHGNASQEATVLTEQFPAKMEWGVADLPTLDGTIKGAQACTPNNGYMMSAITKHPQEAWEVIEYFGSEEVLKGYLEGGYTLPMSNYMQERVDMSKIGRMADFAGADYEAVYPEVPAVSPEGEDWRDALWNACLPEGPDIDETIAKLNKAYNEALDKEVKMGKVKRLVIKDYDPLHPNDGTMEYLSE